MSNGSKKLVFSYNAPVTLTFAIVSLIVLVLGYLTGGESTQLLFEVYRSKISLFWFLRLFGHVLGHATLTHYASNMTMFLLLGPILEEKYGILDMLEMFAITAVVSGLVYIIFFPSAALLGASGLVFMMIVLVSATDMKRGEIPISMILVMVIYLGSQFWDMIVLKDNVSQITHIVGGLCGAVFGGVYSSRRL